MSPRRKLPIPLVPASQERFLPERLLTEPGTGQVRMVTKKPSGSPKAIWTYAYQLLPSQAEGRLDAIKHLLDAEHADAHRGARTWAGRVILEPRVTHILVVSDSPEQSNEINRRLEAELKALAVGFALTAPMAVEEDALE